MVRRFILTGFIVFASFMSYKAWTIYQFNQMPSQQRADILTSIPIEGVFSLTDHNARSVSMKTYFGRHTLIFFGYTWCPDVCPTVLSDIAVVMDNLGQQSKQLVPILITVDPERDTVSVLQDYVSNFHPDIVGLTGSLDEIAKTAKSFRVRYGKMYLDPDEPDDYSMSHSVTLFLMGPDGKPLRTFRHNEGADELTKELRAVFDGT